MAKIKNKVVFITGGSRGIGKATAMLFTQEGAKVVIIARNEPEIKDAVSELEKSSMEVLGLKADVKKLKQIQEAVSKVLDKFGRIDILVNNAGIVTWKYFLKQTESDWDAEIDTNLKGILICTKAIAPHMVKQGDGVIVNISSGSGKYGSPQLATYCATKFAVLGFTQAFAQEVKDLGVRVYTVCPGITKTQMTNFSGIPPEKVAQRILETAKETLGLKPGEDTEIYH